MVTALVGPDEAEACVQEAWLKAYRQIDSFEGRSELSTWLAAIALNEAKGKIRYDHLRKASLQVPFEPELPFKTDGHWQTPPALWDEATPEALLGNETLLEIIQSQLEQLPELQKIVLIMHDMEGIPQEALCNILELNASNFRVLLHRARRKILNAVEAYQRGDNTHVDLPRHQRTIG